MKSCITILLKLILTAQSSYSKIIIKKLKRIFLTLIFIFIRRWLKCIFNREFHPRDVIVMWDAIISQDLSDSLTLINESYSFMFIDFIAVAMMNYIREDCKNYFSNKNLIFSVKKRSK
jgi:hypothetical protein